MEEDAQDNKPININGNVEESSIIVGNRNKVKTFINNVYRNTTVIASKLSLKQQLGIATVTTALLLFSIYLIWSQYLRYDTSHMGNQLNIVVEPFLEERNEHLYNSQKGLILSQYFFSQLENDLISGSFEKETGISVELRSPQDTPPMRGFLWKTPELSAQNISEKINAHIVLYGMITYDDFNRPNLSVRFYVSPEHFDDAQEILGENELGNPILITGNIRTGADLEGENEEFRNRVQITSLTMKAIGAYSGEDFQLSMEYLQKALNDDLWKQTTGSEMIYLLAGNVLSRQAFSVLLSEGEYTALSLIQQAEEHYKNALVAAQEKGDYARAYIGLAGVENFYAIYKARLSNDYADVNLNALNRQEEYLYKALNASYQPETADIKEKVAFIRGQLSFLRFYLTNDHRFLVDAQKNYEQVLFSYEDGNTRITELAAHSYSGIAIVMRSYSQPDYDAILDFYQKAFITTETPSLQAMYLAHQGNVYYEMENCTETIRYYESALAMEGDLEKRITEAQITIMKQRILECNDTSSSDKND